MITHYNTEALERNAREVSDRITTAAERAGREPADVTLIAVSKTFPREAIDAAYDLGLRTFAESRVQEIRQKFAEPQPDDASLHMIGQLQTNKVRQVVPLVGCIQTVDRASLIESLAKELPKRDLTMDILLQVNVSGEEQKSGCSPEDAAALLRQIDDVPELRIQGLMTMAPLVDDPEETRPVFRALRELRDKLQDDTSISLPALSMGMSNDFEIAIEEGATHVRIGRALFGDR
jgi:PLP dependent protein